MKQINCVLYSKRTKASNRRTITKPVKRYLKKKFWVDAREDDAICTKRLLRIQRDVNKPIPTEHEIDATEKTTALTMMNTLHQKDQETTLLELKA